MPLRIATHEVIAFDLLNSRGLNILTCDEIDTFLTTPALLVLHNIKDVLCWDTHQISPQGIWKKRQRGGRKSGCLVPQAPCLGSIIFVAKLLGTFLHYFLLNEGWTRCVLLKLHRILRLAGSH